MTLKECYMNLGGNYNDVIGRLPSERLVQKFLLKFLDDGSFDLLCRSMETESQEEAFRAAHTIKGMCQNLSLTPLAESSDLMAEALRGGDMATAKGLLGRVSEDYKHTADAIRAFKAELPE